MMTSSSGLSGLSVWDLSGQHAAAERVRQQGSEREQLEQAAKGFEQVMIRKWIELAREASWDPKSEDQRSYQAMGDDQLAAAVSNMGGFGMADALVKQMMSQINAARGHQPRVADGQTQSAGLNADPNLTVNSSKR